MKDKKIIIARNGCTKDLKFSDNQKVIFKTWNARKNRITPFGIKKIKWIEDRFASKDIAICYQDADGITLILEVE